jgi:hypothetical protein
MEDHKRNEGDIPSKIRQHLKEYIFNKQYKVQLEDLLSEAASFTAQLKILTLLNTQRKAHSFKVNNTYEENILHIQERALQSLQSSQDEQMINKVEKICSKSKIGKTTIYSDFRADPVLREYWKKREKPKKLTKKKNIAHSHQTHSNITNQICNFESQGASFIAEDDSLKEIQAPEIEQKASPLQKNTQLVNFQDDFFNKGQLSPYLNFEPETNNDLDNT